MGVLALVAIASLTFSGLPVPSAPRAASRREPMCVPRRELLTLLATLAASHQAVPSASATTEGAAADTLEQVSVLSTQARELQLVVRSRGAAARPRLQREMPRLRQLADAMVSVAPHLRLCKPELADCDCSPDEELMQTAARQAEYVRAQLVALDDALRAAPQSFEPFDAGALSYPGGRVERTLEEVCEAADRFLDVASGRPLMTARLAPLNRGGEAGARQAPGSTRAGGALQMMAAAPVVDTTALDAVLWTIVVSAAAYSSGYASEGYEPHKL
jgi:hypothetical protein